MDRQKQGLCVAKTVMAGCTYGLRFSAVADDVSWAANIRRFVPRAFEDPLWNCIIVQGIRCDCGLTT